MSVEDYPKAQMPNIRNPHRSHMSHMRAMRSNLFGAGVANLLVSLATYVQASEFKLEIALMEVRVLFLGC